ncbi:MAG TPA: hypothetical protein VNS63_19995 [Blastocatellia bacterium]|nr:hypothetical protein [Blastocatellia bacterium]
MNKRTMFKRSILVLTALLMVSDLVLAASPQRYGGGRWEYLGQAHVDGNSDHDKISVKADGTFRAIQMEVQDGAIDFIRVVVHFENGGNYDVPVRYRVPSGGRTRVIDLPGDRRDIRSVELWYQKANWKRRPIVKLYGRR